MTGATVLWVVVGVAVAGAPPEDKCQSGKNAAAGKYAACRQIAQAKLLATGHEANFSVAISRCEKKFTDKWQKLIDAAGKAGVACPDAPLTGAQFKAVIDGQSDNLTSALAGSGLHDWATELPQCQSDLATCLAGSLPAARVLRTGQTGCYDTNGAGIDCAGTGQDGDLRKGLARSYTDNGDGTITDNQTGLMWEAKSQDGGIHDWQGAYTWDDAFSLFIAGLNNRCADGTTDCTTDGDTACAGIGNGKCGFAGHRDWRLPNVNELQSLVDHDVFNPSIDPKFNANCGPNPCTVDGAGGTEKCSCTPYGWYWSSSSYVAGPSLAWEVEFSTGGVGIPPSHWKGVGLYVRAVRGGL